MSKGLDYTALTLVIIGAVNWGLIGIFKLDLVNLLVREYDLDLKSYLYPGGSVRSLSTESLRQSHSHGKRVRDKE